MNDTVWVLVSGDEVTFRGVGNTVEGLKKRAQWYENNLANNRETEPIVLEWEDVHESGTFYRTVNDGILFGRYRMWETVINE